MGNAVGVHRLHFVFTVTFHYIFPQLTLGAVLTGCFVIGAWGSVLVTALVTVITFRVQPQVPANLTGHPWGFVFPAIAPAGLSGMFIFLRGDIVPQRERHALFFPCAYLLGMITSAAFGLYPNVLPARGGPALSLSICNARASDRGVLLGLAWWIVG